jgi:hypothetical protein
LEAECLEGGDLFGVQQAANSADHFVLQDVEIEVDDLGELVCALEASWVERNGEAIGGIRQQVAEDLCGLTDLTAEDIDGPEGVPTTIPEADEVWLIRINLPPNI